MFLAWVDIHKPSSYHLPTDIHIITNQHNTNQPKFVEGLSLSFLKDLIAVGHAANSHGPWPPSGSVQQPGRVRKSESPPKSAQFPGFGS